MPLEEKQLTEEQTTENRNSEESSRSKLNDLISSSDVFKSLDLPGAEPEVKKPVVKRTEPVEDEQPDEEVADSEEESTDEATEDVSEEESQEEDMIPKSKVQKRIDALTARIKQLEAETAKPKVDSTPKDDLTMKLEAMSEAELKQAKREARLSQIKHSDDEEMVNKLIDLEEKIDATLHAAPQRFEQQQVQNFQKSAEKLALRAVEDGIDISKSAESIKKIAMDIYQESPELQKSVYGQGRALELAYRHYREVSKFGTTKETGKSELNRLKSQVNTLKKKTSLDTKTVKGNMDKTRSEDIRRKAMSGNYREKLAFIKDDPRFNIDAMIPSEYKEM